MAVLSRLLHRLCAFGAGLSLALVFAIIFFNSLRRYLMGRSVPWGEELPIYLTIYGVMFGLALAYLKGVHIRFTVLTDLLPASAQPGLFLVSDAVTFVTAVALTWSGVSFAARRPDLDASGLTGTADALAEATGLTVLEWLGRVGPYEYAIAFGGALLAVVAAVKFVERLSGRREAAA